MHICRYYVCLRKSKHHRIAPFVVVDQHLQPRIVLLRGDSAIGCVLKVERFCREFLPPSARGIRDKIYAARLRLFTYHSHSTPQCRFRRDEM